ncbi:MAG: hypothetical protein KDA61_15305, partial [Planctomycetales bacterium]|nr:hypothetical protein [Planctomycetales bacterium]
MRRRIQFALLLIAYVASAGERLATPMLHAQDRSSAAASLAEPVAASGVASPLPNLAELTALRELRASDENVKETIRKQV